MGKLGYHRPGKLFSMTLRSGCLKSALLLFQIVFLMFNVHTISSWKGFLKSIQSQYTLPELYNISNPPFLKYKLLVVRVSTEFTSHAVLNYFTLHKLSALTNFSLTDSAFRTSVDVVLKLSLPYFTDQNNLYFFQSLHLSALYLLYTITDFFLTNIYHLSVHEFY